jgi:phosphoglycerol geranylgeranyltransferase
LKEIVLNSIKEKIAQGKKLLAVLIDPDKYQEDFFLDSTLNQGIDLVFVGGSLIYKGSIEKCIESVKQKINVPVLIFPGHATHISANADALLLLSLISGRNAEFLIGNHVIAAPIIKQMQLETISVGYMLVESQNTTTVEYISNTLPIPQQKPEIAVCTALAGEMIGNKMIYLDAGSGAKIPIAKEFISKVKEALNIPLIVGGGINEAQKAYDAWYSGANIIVVGNNLEKNKLFLNDLIDVKNKLNNCKE